MFRQCKNAVNQLIALTIIQRPFYGFREGLKLTTALARQRQRELAWP